MRVFHVRFEQAQVLRAGLRENIFTIYTSIINKSNKCDI